jgi:phenylacetate-CoA ligase
MLRLLVRHAYTTTPFYRNLMAGAGLNLRDVTSTADLDRLPLTSKLLMKKVPAEDLVSAPFRKSRLRSYQTTGSTGTPFTVRRTGFEDLLLQIFNLRCMKEYGLRARDRVLRVRSRGNWEKPLLWRAAETAGLFRQDRLPTTLAPRALAEALRRQRPEIIASYTAVLSRAAEILIREGQGPLGCRLVVVGAELVTPRIRRLLERAFGGKVLDTYSSQEVGLMAWECPKSGLYHVCDDNVILEVLKDGCRATCREGEEGEIVVTCLHTLAMPFIRFRLEDVAVRGPTPCPCGASYSTIAGVRGRLQDYFLRPDGSEVYAWYVVSLFPEHAPWIQQYDLEQDEAGRIVMRVVPLRPPRREDIESCSALIKSVLGQDLDIRIEIVPDIPLGPGGKYYYQRSRRLSVYRPEDWESS